MIRRLYENDNYDTYDSCVVAAYNKEEAVKIHPYKEYYENYIYCPELDETFSTIKEAYEKYNINKTSIGYCLCGKQKHAGKHPVTGEKLSWVKLENKSS